MSENIQQQLALAQQYARAGAYAAAQNALRKVIDKARTNVGSVAAARAGVRYAECAR